MFVACRLTSIWPGAISRLHLERLRFRAFFVTAACVEWSGTYAFSIQTVCAFTKACAPKCESSRPAAVFDAAYGNARVRSSDAIDENTAGVEIARDFASQPDVSGPEIAAQTELACIGRTNGRINVWNAG